MANEANDLSTVIKYINEARQANNAIWENSDDVKAGRCTVEDEKNEPGYKLYNGIIDSAINIIKSVGTGEMYSDLSALINPAMAANIISFIALSMSTASYNGITTYDTLLKEELTKQFNLVVDKMNECMAEIMAHRSVLEVHTKRLGEIEKRLNIDDLKKNVE